MKLVFLLALQAAAPAPQPPEEARIPFASFRSIRSFHPVGDEVVYLQDQRRDWYRATLTGPCFDLATAIRIGLDTRPGDTVDNTSSLIVDGQTCPIHSLVRSDPPPRERPR
jgi:hypothetical protein